MIDPEIASYINGQIAKSQKDARYSTSNAVYHTHNGIDAPKIQYGNIVNAPNYFITTALTAGTTPTPFFSSNGANFPLTVTSIFLISNDTTAGNITVKNNGNTVATIAKGTVAGAMVGASSLANTAYNANFPFTVESSSTGNARVLLTFTIP